ncbi:FUSC family protein [Frankia sp. AgB1.9]|uniref:FUSC family protein n=1 Tax=unclassified Frankia TaxID=2632575 RepID=UPI001931E240|nr:MULTISPECIES: FUSC family protein [unclassified Frankia]MBL7546531.1 FUSC family protein [Frankia sp. AgB1.9]MBL7622184.1 FUSC family protein [Frankia sp. AgB1.8]
MSPISPREWLVVAHGGHSAWVELVRRGAPVSGRVSLRGAFTVRRPPPGRGRLALVSALATGIPLIVGELTGQLALGLTATLGAVTAIYYPRSSWRYRARALPVVAVGSAAAGTVGALSGGNPWRTAIAVAAVAFVATVLFAALLAPQPGAVPIVVACAVATQLPPGIANIGTRAGLTLAGAAFAYLLTMIGARGDQTGPSRRAVAEALKALATMSDTVGTKQTEVTRHDAEREIRRAEVIVARDRPGGALAAIAARLRRVFTRIVDYAALTGRPPPDSVARRLLDYAADVASGRYDPGRGTGARRWRPPPRPRAAAAGDTALATAWTGASARASSLVHRAAAPGRRPQRTRSSSRTAAAERGTRTGRAAARRGHDHTSWAWHRLAVTVADLAHPTGVRPLAPIIAPTRDLLADGLRPRSPAWPWATRCCLATAVAALLAIAAGVDRPYWAPVAAASVLEVRTARVAGQHTVQHMLGTTLGALAAFALLTVPLPVWSLIASVMALQAAIELLNPANGGFGALLVMPLTMLVAQVSGPGQSAESLLVSRLVDTLLGLAVGLAASLLLWPRVAGHRLPYALSDCVGAIGALLANLLAEAPGAPPGPRSAPRPNERVGREARRTQRDRRRGAARHHVEATLEWLSEMHVEANNEPGEAARATWPTVVAARRLGYLVLLEPPGLRDALPATAGTPEGIRLLFGQLAAGMRGDAPPPLRQPVQLPPFPPLLREFAALVDSAPQR